MQVPQVRQAPETYRSRLMEALEGPSPALERLVQQMYVRGLSTRDIEEALEQATGQRLLSRSAVSELSESLWEDYQAFTRRDLSDFAVEYLFLDAVFESLRRQGAGRRGCCAPGGSAPMGARCCCIWPWATRSPTPTGWTFCGTWWPGG